MRTLNERSGQAVKIGRENNMKQKQLIKESVEKDEEEREEPAFFPFRHKTCFVYSRFLVMTLMSRDQREGITAGDETPFAQPRQEESCSMEGMSHEIVNWILSSEY